MKRALSLVLMVMVLLASLPNAVMEEIVEAPLEEEAIVKVYADDEEIEVVPAPVEEDESSYDEGEEEIVAAPEEDAEFVVEDGRLTAYNGVDEVVELPEDVEVVGAWAFAGNHIVKSVVVPASVKAIEDFAFYGCAALETVVYADGAEIEIGEHAFEGCDKLIVEEPVEEELPADEPVEEEPVEDELVEEEPVDEEPAEEEAPAEESVEEEPVAEEPVEEEPVGEEPAEEEPVDEESAEEASSEEEAPAESPAGEEPDAEDPTALDAPGDQEAMEEDDEEIVVLVGSRATLAITGQPVNYTGDIGDTAKFTVTATGTSLSYQWQYMSPGTSYWQNSNAAAAKTKTMSVAITAARDGQKYRCLVTDASGNKVYSNAVKIMVAWTKFTTQPKDYVGTVGKVAYFTVKTDNSNVKYQWQYKAGSDGTWTNSYMTGYNTASFNPTITVGRHGYKYRCKVTDGDGHENYSDVATLYVKAYIAEYTSSVIAPVNTEAEFTVKAYGKGLTYQWQYKKPASANWANSTSTGATTKKLTVTSTVARSGYQYRCIVTDTFGNKAMSDPAGLYIPAKILTQPEHAYGKVGTSAVYKVEATGENLKYSWEYRTADSTTYTKSYASGYNTDTLTIGITAARSGNRYRCVVTDAEGNTATSSAAVLYPVATITTQPKTQTVAEGKTAKFTVAAVGWSIKYQWQFRTSSTGTWKNSTLTGYNMATLSVGATTARNGYEYRCVVTDYKGGTATSSAAKLQLPIVFTTQPENYVGSVGETAKFKAVAESSLGLTLTYQWQYSKAGSTTWANSTAASATWKTLSVDVTTARHGQKYRCVITDKNGNTATSNVVTITVPIVIDTQPVDYTGAIGDTAKFSASATSNTGSTLTYQWQYKSKTMSDFANSTVESATWKSLRMPVTAARVGYQYRCIITDKAGNKAITNVAEMKALPIIIDTQPANQSAFPGETATFTVAATSASGAKLSYQWQWRKNASGTWANSTGTGNKTASMTVEVTEARNGYQYQCIVTADGVSVTSQTATLTATDTFTLNNVTYKLVSGSLTVTGYTSSTKTTYAIPQTAKGYTVTKIGESAFEGNTKLKSIDLPDTVTVIGKRAFANCTALTTMN